MHQNLQLFVQDRYNNSIIKNYLNRGTFLSCNRVSILQLIPIRITIMI